MLAFAGGVGIAHSVHLVRSRGVRALPGRLVAILSSVDHFPGSGVGIHPVCAVIVALIFLLVGGLPYGGRRVQCPAQVQFWGW